jgi:hypothetical protein
MTSPAPTLSALADQLDKWNKKLASYEHDWQTVLTLFSTPGSTAPTPPSTAPTPGSTAPTKATRSELVKYNDAPKRLHARSGQLETFQTELDKDLDRVRARVAEARAVARASGVLDSVCPKPAASKAPQESGAARKLTNARLQFERDLEKLRDEIGPLGSANDYGKPILDECRLLLGTEW